MMITLLQYQTLANRCASRSLYEAEADAYDDIRNLCLRFSSVEAVKRELARLLETEDLTTIQRHVYQLMIKHEEPLDEHPLYIRGRSMANVKKVGY